MKTYRVKPLQWMEGHDSFYGQYAVALDVCGDHYRASGESHFFLVHGNLNVRPDTIGDYATMQEAKDAAEKHYLSRLLPALEEVDA